jgi:ribulose-phosphate 3-epimerase
MDIEIIPSILSADFARLAEAVSAVEAGGARTVQVDVMDGHFVPNITVGMPVVRALADSTSVALDVHLMIDRPERYVDAFADAGAAVITVHAEATSHLHRTVHRVRDLGARPGVAINPATPLTALDQVLDDIEVALVMTVNPGFGGQSFIESMLPKIDRLRTLVDKRGLSTAIQVDGGIDEHTAGPVAAAGATQLVAGSSVFAADVPPAEAIHRLRLAAQRGLDESTAK